MYVRILPTKLARSDRVLPLHNRPPFSYSNDRNDSDLSGQCSDIRLVVRREKGGRMSNTTNAPAPRARSRRGFLRGVAGMTGAAGLSVLEQLERGPEQALAHY